MTQQDGRHDDPGDKVREELSKASDSIREDVAEVSANAREAARQEANTQFGKGKEVADEQLDTLSSTIDEAASRLDEDGHPLASYAAELSAQLGQLSTTIQSSSLDDVARSTHRLARDNPGLFMLGSVALGFAAARFIKASDEREHRSRHAYGTGDESREYREGGYSTGGYSASGREHSSGPGAAPVTTVSSAPSDGPTTGRYVHGGEA